MWVETTQHDSVSGEGCDSIDGCHGHGNTYNSRGNSGMCGKKEAVWVETVEHDSMCGEGCDRVDGSLGHGSMHHAVSRPCTVEKKRSCRGEERREEQRERERERER